MFVPLFYTGFTDGLSVTYRPAGLSFLGRQTRIACIPKAAQSSVGSTMGVWCSLQNVRCCHDVGCLCCRTHVNVISGRNGSGKSAVLQAMQAALGSKAKDTGRGDNFRELVRTGCHEARVKVRGVGESSGDGRRRQEWGWWAAVTGGVSIDRDAMAAGGAGFETAEAVGQRQTQW
jgi:hypothetical protein